MSNISITRRCARDCDFCFAAEERSRGVLDMSPEAFESTLDFLERSGIPDARLMGGEPLLHPVFGSYAARAIERGFALTVMTGGLVPDAAVETLEALPAERVTVYLNTATPGVDDPALVSAQERLCATLGGRVEAGLTLVSAESDPDFLLQWIARFGLKPGVRIGVAHPVVGGHNAHVSTSELRAVGATIEAFVQRAEREGVGVGLDCGITPCMFSPSFAEKYPHVIVDCGLHCGPIVDLLPEGDAIACYALGSLARVAVDGEATRMGLIDALALKLEERPSVAAPGVFAECAECAYRLAGECTGGCRARRMRSA